MHSLKFKNPGEQTVRVASLTGLIALFEPGETHEVPAVLRSECLALNLTEIKDAADPVEDKPVKPLTKAQQAAAAKAAKAAAEAADDDGDSEIKVADGQ